MLTATLSLSTMMLVLINSYSFIAITGPQPHALIPQTKPYIGKLWNMHVLCAPHYFWPTMALWWITCGLDSLLFFFRVRAVFSYSRIARAAFTALWAVIGVVPVPLVYSGLYYGSHCSRVTATFAACPDFSWFTLSMLLAAMAYHTLLFFFISREIGKCTPEGRLTLRTLLTSEGLYNVSKSLLRSGQVYYVYVHPLVHDPASADRASYHRISMAILVLQAVNIWSWNPNAWYAYAIGVINQPASCCLSYRVFRALTLCDRELELSQRDIRTEDVEAMIAAALMDGGDRADTPLPLSRYLTAVTASRPAITTAKANH